MRLKIACHLSGLIVACLAPAASAVDGVLEINEVCAVNTGCFAGDTAGFPVTITSPGSYRLTGNLSSGYGSRIEISADSVTLDLNGNEIGAGIEAGPAVSSTGSDTRVTDGVVAGSLAGCIIITGAGSHVDHVRTSGHVQLGRSAHVTSTQIDAIYFIDEPALQTGQNSVVTGNTVKGDNAIIAGDQSVVRNNTAQNGSGEYAGIGISCSSCTIDSNTIRMLGHFGVGVGGSKSVVINNVVRGSGSQYDTGVGISCSRCTVSGNVVTDSPSFGLNDSSGATGYSSNQFDGNNGGNANPQVSGGIEMGVNICGGDATCP